MQPRRSLVYTAKRMSSPDFSQRYGPVALVTGAAHGIGRGFAQGLARRATPLLLVDMDAEGLESTAKTLREDHGATVETLVANLSVRAELDHVCEVGLERGVGLLVNNAGYGHRGSFLGIDLEDHLDVLDVNIRALVVLTHRLAPAMAERGRGGIIFTASTASLIAMPGVTNYAATKAFVKSLSDGLHGELHDKGIDVVALMPGLTRGRGTTAGLSEAEIRALPAMDPGPVAEAALAALGKRFWVVPGWKNRLQKLIYDLLPRGPIVRRRGRQFDSKT